MQSPVVPGYTERSRYIVHDLREPVAENRFAWPAINYVALTSKPSYVDDGIVETLGTVSYRVSLERSI